jgi:peroxiredoxin
LLLAANIALLVQNLKLKKSLGNQVHSSSNLMSEITAAPDFMVFDLDGKELHSSEILANPSFKILIFFSPSDCITCFNKVDFWKEVKERENLDIIGIVQHINIIELKNWIESEKFQFQIYCDLENKVKQAFRINATPLMMLIDEIGHILLVSDFKGASSDYTFLIKQIDHFL